MRFFLLILVFVLATPTLGIARLLSLSEYEFAINQIHQIKQYDARNEVELSNAQVSLEFILNNLVILCAENFSYEISRSYFNSIITQLLCKQYETLAPETILPPAFLVDRLIQAGADANARCFEGANPLILSARAPFSYEIDLSIFKLVQFHISHLGLITQRTNLNQRDDFGRTALSYAAETGNLKLVQMLLKLGGDATQDEADILQFKPVHYALANNHFEVASLLGASPETIVGYPTIDTWQYRYPPAQTTTPLAWGELAAPLRMPPEVVQTAFMVSGSLNRDPYLMGSLSTLPDWPPADPFREQGSLYFYSRPQILGLPNSYKKIRFKIPNVPRHEDLRADRKSPPSLAYLSRRLEHILSSEELKNLDSVLTYLGQGATSDAYYYHNNRPTDSQLATMYQLPAGYSSSTLEIVRNHWAKANAHEVIKVRFSSPWGRGIHRAKTAILRDLIVSDLVAQLASHFRYVDHNGRSRPLVRGIPYKKNFREISMGILRQPVIRGESIYNVHRATQDFVIDASKFALIHQFFPSIEEEKRRTLALKRFYELTHYDILFYENHFKLTPARGKVFETTPRTGTHSSVNAGADANQGRNGNWELIQDDDGSWIPIASLYDV